MRRHHSPGNPELTARLKGRTDAELADFCSRILLAHGAAEGEAMLDRRDARAWEAIRRRAKEAA
jgi:hypothetical protein